MPQAYRQSRSPEDSQQDSISVSLEGMQIGEHWTVRSRLYRSKTFEFWHCQSNAHVAPATVVFARQEARSSDSETRRGQGPELTDGPNDALARLAFLSSMLPERFTERSISTMLDAARPHVLFPHRTSIQSNEWFGQLAQPASMRTRLEMARHLVEGLSEIHRLGFAHTRLEEQNIFIEKSGLPILVGLGHCLPIATCCEPPLPPEHTSIRDRRPQGSPPAPPEYNRPMYEVSSAQDIFQLAYVFAEWFGPKFLASPLGQAMIATKPADRPTASALSSLLANFVNELGFTHSHPAGLGNARQKRRAA